MERVGLLEFVEFNVKCGHAETERSKHEKIQKYEYHSVPHRPLVHNIQKSGKHGDVERKRINHAVHKHCVISVERKPLFRFGFDFSYVHLYILYSERGFKSNQNEVFFVRKNYIVTRVCRISFAA